MYVNPILNFLRHILNLKQDSLPSCWNNTTKSIVTWLHVNHYITFHQENSRLVNSRLYILSLKKFIFIKKKFIFTWYIRGNSQSQANEPTCTYLVYILSELASGATMSVIVIVEQHCNETLDLYHPEQFKKIKPESFSHRQVGELTSGWVF